jgi:signal transduction histidine kinase
MCPANGCAGEARWLLDQVSHEDTVAGVSEVLVAGAVHLLRAAMATLYVRGPEPGSLSLEAWHTVDPRFPIPAERLDAGDPDPAAQVVARRAPAFLPAREIRAERPLPASACLFAAPLVAGGEVLGVLTLAFAGPVDDADREVIASLIAPSAAFLHRARILAERRPTLPPARADVLPEDLHQTLVRHEKLRALGDMAGGIAHEFKNVLSPLSLYIQLLRRSFQRGDATARCEEALAEMTHVIERGVQTADRLRDFSRHAPEAPAERVEVDVMAHEALELCRPRLADGITLERSFTGPGTVTAHPSEMMLALLHLINNAVDAAGEGGTVAVSTGADGSGSWVRVADDGPGVPEALRERIFDPFFTTKGDGGTGLGLAMVEAFARRHDGRLTLEPAAGRGAVFTLWLPAAGLTPMLA